jgi:hypothetical protein
MRCEEQVFLLKQITIIWTCTYLKQLVAAAPDRNVSTAKSTLVIPFPMGDGIF